MIAAIVLAATVCSSGQATTSAAVQAAQRVWNEGFDVVDTNGGRWTPATLRGRVVLVDVWATWCAPCLEELPALRRLHQRFHSQGFEILGLSADVMSARSFRGWLLRQNVTWPNVRDGRGTESPLLRRLDIDAIPRSFLVDRDGCVVAIDLRKEALAAAVEAAMAAGESGRGDAKPAGADCDRSAR